MTMRAIQCRRLLLWPLVEKFAFIHVRFFSAIILQRMYRQLWVKLPKSMPMKKKPKSFRAVTAVKALARERIGEPRPAQIVPDRKRKDLSQKHKPTLKKLLESDE